MGCLCRNVRLVLAYRREHGRERQPVRGGVGVPYANVSRLLELISKGGNCRSTMFHVKHC